MGKEVFIDSNIFLEIFLKDPKAEECKKLLKSMQENNGIKKIVSLDKHFDKVRGVERIRP